MKLFLFRALPLLLCGLATACAYAPGFYTGTQSAGPAWLDLGRDAADTPPPGALLSITPELLRQQRLSQSVGIKAQVKNLFDTPKPYAIGAGDVLNIVVWDHPELSMQAAGAAVGDTTTSMSPVSNGYNVSPAGTIQFPYVGLLQLAGLTESEVRDLLTARLAFFIKNPQITVRIQSYRSHRIYIDGEVRTPGVQALNDIPLTLPEAIGRAGGFTPVADRAHIAVTRNGQTTTVNLPQLLAQGVDPSNILMRHGDLVRVLGREDAKVFVLGEVLRASSQSLRNGRLTLNEALSEAGGINPNTANPRQIYVVRTAKLEQAELYHLDAKSPMAHALAEGFELQARDVIYVDPVPLVRWNRVISLILPSAQAVTSTRSATGN